MPVGGASACTRRVQRLCRQALGRMAAEGAKVEESAGLERADTGSLHEAERLDKLNNAPAEEAEALFYKCCESAEWAAKLAAVRPFKHVRAMLEHADDAWWSLGESAWRDGVKGHSKLGEKKAEQKKAMSGAAGSTLARMQAANDAYLAKFGFRCVIYAAGRSAEQLLEVMADRMGNDPASELRVAAEQVMMITRLRLERILNGDDYVPSRGDGRSPITTHILDTSSGKPAAEVALRLEIRSSHDPTVWRPLSSGRTNSDGRVGNLLPPTYALRPGVYRVVFDVEEYFSAQELDSFYPGVTIAFKIADPTQHFHVPLLLNPFGFTTYRGS